VSFAISISSSSSQQSSSRCCEQSSPCLQNRASGFVWGYNPVHDDRSDFTPTRPLYGDIGPHVLFRQGLGFGVQDSGFLGTSTCNTHRAVVNPRRFRAKRRQLKTCSGRLPASKGRKSQGRCLALTVLCVPYSLESGHTLDYAVRILKGVVLNFTYVTALFGYKVGHVTPRCRVLSRPRPNNPPRGVANSPASASVFRIRVSGLRFRFYG